MASYPYYNDDPSDPNGKKQRNMWDRGALQGLGGMFSGLRSNFLQPHSSQLLLGGLGMLGGGPESAMKGLVAGSALDTERTDKRKRDAAIQALMNDPEGAGILSGITGAQRDYLLANPAVLDKVIADRMSPPSAGVTINTGGNLPTGYRFIDPNNPSAGAERIEGVHGSEAEQKSEALLTMVEPDYQTALSTFSSLSNPADLAASYGGDIGRYFQSADYQVATDAITNIAQSYLYSASGQAAPDAEVRRMARLVTPALTDKPEAIAMKKKRLGSMVEAIRQKTGTPSNGGQGNLTPNEDGSYDWSP